jgi:hypothetical protein
LLGVRVGGGPRRELSHADTVSCADRLRIGPAGDLDVSLEDDCTAREYSSRMTSVHHLGQWRGVQSRLP